MQTVFLLFIGMFSLEFRMFRMVFYTIFYHCNNNFFKYINIWVLIIICFAIKFIQNKIVLYVSEKKLILKRMIDLISI